MLDEKTLFIAVLLIVLSPIIFIMHIGYKLAIEEKKRERN